MTKETKILRYMPALPNTPFAYCIELLLLLFLRLQFKAYIVSFATCKAVSTFYNAEMSLKMLNDK